VHRILWLPVCLVLATPTYALEFVPLGKKPLDARKTAPRSAPGPDCGLAIDVQLGDSVCGDTTGRPDTVSAYGCSDWQETGGEVVYRLDLSTPAAVEIRLDAACDLDVFLLSGCGQTVECLAFGDIGIRSLDALVGEVFVVVDGYVGAECGFCIEFREVEPLDGAQPGDFDPHTFLSCNTSTREGSTCDGDNRISYEPCGAFVEAGPEDWYRIRLFPHGSFYVEAVMPEGDVALWLLQESDPTCLAGVDAWGFGQPEILINFAGAAPRDFYLVIDSYGPECAEYTLEIRCFNGEVSSGRSSWGRVKSRFGEEGLR